MNPAEHAKEAILRALAGAAPDTLPWEAPPPEGLFLVVRDPEGKVRASIGTSRAEGDAGRLLARLARAAVADDPRFPPLTEAEVGSVRVWVLGAGRDIGGPDELRPGEAVRVREGRFSGVFLPDNDAGPAWDPLAYLKQACRRAGLEAHAFQRAGVEIRAYPTTLYEATRP
ncbi:MAG TPA: AMMECR1 domain-containing protein [Fredinandcohnia sp.]|nr:AMMECR1 domain-containing protein [Fredinandcohnia sp.]